MRRAAPLVSLLVVIGAACGVARAGDAGIEHFEAKVRPVLVAHCYECHSAQAKKLGGNLLLDSREGVRKGGDSGASIVPGLPEESPLIAAVRYSADSVHMPPKGKLPEPVIADFEAWVERWERRRSDPREHWCLAAAASESWEETMRGAIGGACGPS